MSPNLLLDEALERVIRRRSAAHARDAVALAEAAGLVLDPWQAGVLRSRASRILLNVTRQGGKSTVTACLALHTAMYAAPGQDVLLLSPTFRQSSLLFRVVKQRHAALGASAEPVREDSATRLEFGHGGQIVCLPGKEETIRGFSNVALIVIDEAARVADPLYQSVRPMLAVSGGRLVALSTPFGKRGFFFEEWTGGNVWERYTATAYDCPRIPSEFIEAERRSMPDTWFRQEYLCEFAETTDQVFSYEDVQRALDPTVTPLFSSAA